LIIKTSAARDQKLEGDASQKARAGSGPIVIPLFASTFTEWPGRSAVRRLIELGLKTKGKPR
jgi:hypothetical protein